MLTDIICRMKKLLSILFLICTLPVLAATNVVVNGISYELDLESGTAALIRPATPYTGFIDIPAEITPEGYEGRQFKVKAIYNNVFPLNSEVTGVKFPATIDTVGYNAFRETTNLKTVEITDLDAWANISFRDARAIPTAWSKSLTLNGKLVTDVVITAKAGKVKPFVFQSLEDLKSVTIEDGVTLLGESSFASCTGLQTVTIPASVDSIGFKAFGGCSQLSEFVLKTNKLRTIPGSMLNGSAIKSFVVPEGVTVIDNQAFQNCTQLTEVSLPATLQRFLMMCFAGASNLQKVVCNAANPPGVFSYVGDPTGYGSVFDSSIFSTCVLQVPAESIDKYKKAVLWKEFINIEPIPVAQEKKSTDR